jgi:hypothetical protein
MTDLAASVNGLVKEISHLVADTHNGKGRCIVALDMMGGPKGVDASHLVSLSGDDGVRVRKGKRIYPKADVRSFMFERRGSRALRRRGAVIWTNYVGEEDASVIGFGALVGDRVAERARRKGLEVVEIGGP